MLPVQRCILLDRPRGLLVFRTVLPRCPRLKKSVAANLLSDFESTRPGAEVFFHNLIGNTRHRLNQDVRRLRPRFLPNSTFGKVGIL